MSATAPKIAFVAADTSEAKEAAKRLAERYAPTAQESADILIALGGDGHMLEVLHANLENGRPIYGMNCGTVGFLMNRFDEAGLLERLAKAQAVALHPLSMRAMTTEGKLRQASAINEVSLLRESRQAAKIRILVDGRERLGELVCDGVLVATPAGSTAYNLSAHGPILPLGASLLAMTPISAFRPRRWRGALLPDRAKVRFEVLEAGKRPVSATADFTEVRDVVWVEVEQDHRRSLTLLFDPEHNLEERILLEQFTP